MKKKNLYDVCIVGGLGHAGLPLGISFAKSGKRVILYDINQEAIDVLSQGKMPFMETGAEEVLRDVLGKTLFATSEKQTISDSHFIIVVIGTPVDEHLNPKFTAFKKFFSEIVEFIQDDQHIILRSTIFPGTTEKVKELLRSHGKQTRVSFCPERIAEGKAMEELRSLPQIVASFDEPSLREAKELFLSLTDDVLFLKPVEAELAKLFTNVWRYIQFSISNQFYQITTQCGLDFYKIYNAMTHNYPRTRGFGSAGFTAGPCLFKDTMQLAAFSNNTFFLGHAAMLINEGLPNFIIQRLKERYSLKDKIVGILGMAFKGNSDDPRESLSYKLKKILEIDSKKVLCTDPFVKDDSLISLDEVITHSDILILGAPHTLYKQIDIDFSSKIVVDIWNFFGKGGSF
ncbi:MAG: nucleotide sugar dehydrogenase [Nitrospirota bacterium]|nr:nucleotide sugar dehydrogenase [Nitrospirota bacterium]MDH5769391.1 nucleotide sugar dehydrogenase [Nitrospirota bacterium]